MLSAMTDDEAPLFAWILQMGRKRPPGKASLNSLKARVLIRCGS